MLFRLTKSYILTYEVRVLTYHEIIKSESVTSNGYCIEVTSQLHHWIYWGGGQLIMEGHSQSCLNLQIHGRMNSSHAAAFSSSLSRIFTFSPPMHWMGDHFQRNPMLGPGNARARCWATGVVASAPIKVVLPHLKMTELTALGDEVEVRIG